MTTIIIMILLMIMIFLRNRRDIFLLYYVKKKEERMHSWRRGSQDRTCDLLSHSVYASRRNMANGLPLILLLLPGKYTAFLLLASWKLPGAAVHIIFLFSFHHISFPLFLPESSPFVLTVVLFRSISIASFLALRKRNLTTIILFGDIFIQ